MTSPDRTSGSHGSGLVEPLLAERSRVLPSGGVPVSSRLSPTTGSQKTPAVHPQISPYDITLWPPLAPPASRPAV